MPKSFTSCMYMDVEARLVSSWQELINKGEAVYKQAYQEGGLGSAFLSGPEYETWVAKGIIFMERAHLGEAITNRFMDASTKVTGQSIPRYHTMLGILKAPAEMGE